MLRRRWVVVWLILITGTAVLRMEPGTGAPPAPAPPPALRLFTGESKAVGQGTVTSWVLLTAEGQPSAIGMTLSEEALTALPDVATEYALALPPQARDTPFKELALNWQPHGHIPPEIYDVPHFDLHYYLLTPEARGRITARGADLARIRKSPPAAAIPQGYVFAAGSEEPYMGGHWVDLSSPEFHQHPFTATLIYGFYNGRMAFIEPMVSLAFLQTKPAFSAPIAQPTQYPAPGYYPTAYAIRYDAPRRQYLFILQGMVARK